MRPYLMGLGMPGFVAGTGGMVHGMVAPAGKFRKVRMLLVTFIEFV